jgi:heptosyltransferase II
MTRPHSSSRAGSGPHSAPATGLVSPGAAWAGQRILVSRLRFMGDAILSLPLLAALRRTLPDTELHYLAEPASLEMLAAQPEIDVRWSAPRGALATLGLAATLRRQHFAAAIDLFCNPRSALLVRATCAPVRVGEDRRVRRHAYTLARHLLPGRSAVEQHLDALHGLGLPAEPAAKPVLALHDAERAAGCARWRALGVPAGIVLHLGASQPDKEWPVEHALEFVRAVAAANLPVLLTTAPARLQPSQRVAAQAGSAAQLLPPLPLREVLGVLAAAAAVVSVDGALVHAAVGLGRPTLALFGPTDAKIWFPYESFGPYRVLQAAPAAAGTRPAMQALRPAAVCSALAALLATSPAGDREVRP